LQNKGWNQKSEKQQTHTKHRKGTNKVVDFLSIRERKTMYISSMRIEGNHGFFPHLASWVVDLRSSLRSKPDPFFQV
jgi:hypothetical protein